MKNPAPTSITVSAQRERDRWSGDLTLGVNVRQGNADFIEYNMMAGVERRTPRSRAFVDYLGSFNETEGERVANDHRVNVVLDMFSGSRFFDAHNKMVKGTSKNMNKTLSSDEVTNADIDTVWDGYFEQRAAYNQEMLDLRYQLKDQLTREEWRQVFDGESSLNTDRAIRQ